MQIDSLDFGVLDAEYVVAKASMLELLEKQSPYRPAGKKGQSFHDRVDRLLSTSLIPDRHFTNALVLFASTIYLTDDMLAAFWRCLSQQLMEHLGVPDPLELATRAHFFCVDGDTCLTSFLRASSIPKRNERELFPPLHAWDQFRTFLSRSDSSQQPAPGLINVLHRPYWVLLTDNNLSGTSALRELREMAEICGSLRAEGIVTPKLIVASQIGTQLANETILDGFTEQPSDLPTMLQGLYLDHRYRVNSEECGLFSSPVVAAGVRDFCQWFDEAVLRHDNSPTMAEMRRHTSDGELGFGFKSVGLTIVTQSNAPNNSVTPLWYRPEDQPELPLTDSPGESQSPQDPVPQYIGPYPREHSRGGGTLVRTNPRRQSSLEPAALQALKGWLDDASD